MPFCCKFSNTARKATYKEMYVLRPKENLYNPGWHYGENQLVNSWNLMDLLCWGLSLRSWSFGENQPGNLWIWMGLVCWGLSERSWSYGENIVSSYSYKQNTKLWNSGSDCLGNFVIAEMWRMNSWRLCLSFCSSWIHSIRQQRKKTTDCV